MSAVCRLRVWACAEYELPHRWRAALHDPCSGCNATVCLSVFLSAALPVVLLDKSVCFVPEAECCNQATSHFAASKRCFATLLFRCLEPC